MLALRNYECFDAYLQAQQSDDNKVLDNIAIGIRDAKNDTVSVCKPTRLAGGPHI